jgi:uncharacterized protein (TIGR02246 family)
MTTENSKATDDGQIRGLMDDWARALRAKDINRLMADYAPDVLAFDLINPLQYLGSDALRKRVDEWFSSFQGPINFETRDLNITANSDVAFSHCLNRFSGTKIDGGKIDMWIRATVCFRKIDGKWMVTHQHSSVPFDPESSEASLDLKPEP